MKMLTKKTTSIVPFQPSAAIANRTNIGLAFVAFAMTMLLCQGCTTISLHDRGSVPAVIARTSAAPPAPDALQANKNNSQPSAQACQAWFEKLDVIVEAAGIRDAGEHRLDGFPHLRIDRFIASFQPQLREKLQAGSAAEPKMLPPLLWYARGLDLAARQNEFSNLPQRWRNAVGLTDAAAVRTALTNCSQALVRRDLGENGSNTALLEKLAPLWRVPDHYASWKRALGLYPLTSIPFFKGILGWQRSTKYTFLAAANIIDATQEEAFIRYQLAAEHDEGKTSVDIERSFRDSVRNVLGIPQFSTGEWQRLLNRHAPAFEVETKGIFDRIGEIKFGPHEQVIVEPAKSAVYQRVGFTRIAGKTHVQLSYSAWFTERPKSATAAFDLLGGHLDGVIVRITLDHDGLPMLVDSIHGCGCYHLFFPTPTLAPSPAPTENIEWAFVPETLPTFVAGQRVVVRIASGTHYLTSIRIVDAFKPATPLQIYQLKSERDLLSLPVESHALDARNENGTGHQSIFGPNGLVAGTERGERFFFWPMGILSPGAMRQWGTHATAFVGTRHFDDADLIDKRFNIVNVNNLRQIGNAGHLEIDGGDTK